MKLRYFSLIIACALVASCNAIDTALYQEQTLNSLAESEKRIIERLEELQCQPTEDNTESIATLQEEVNFLKTQVAESKRMLAAYISSREVVPEIPEQQTTPIIVTNSGDYVLGALERVTIEAIKQSFDARVDTGAETSSINAMDIEFFERNGDDWVRFHVIDAAQEASEENWVEAPVVRFVNIRQASNDKPERRAVVKLWTRLGNMREQNEFSLADRSQMSHPVLLGREFIRDVAVVDVSKEFLQSERE
ncbi:MAG: ATP-dependent zinc protease [Pseudomonadota bacterium]